VLGARVVDRERGFTGRQGDEMPHERGERARRAESERDLVAELGRRLEVTVDVDVAGQVRLDDGQLARREQHASQCAAAVEAEGEPRVGAAVLDAAIPVADVHRPQRRGTEQGLDHGARVAHRAIRIRARGRSFGDERRERLARSGRAA
jgi:hypothetical protein